MSRAYLISKKFLNFQSSDVSTQLQPYQCSPPKRHYTSFFFANTQSSLAKWFASFPRKPFQTFFGLSHLVPYLFPTQAGLHLRFLSSHWTICFLLFSSRQVKIWLYFGEPPSLLDSSNHLSCRPFFDSFVSIQL